MPDAADATDEGAVAASVREVVLRDNPAVNALPAFSERRLTPERSPFDKLRANDGTYVTVITARSIWHPKVAPASSTTGSEPPVTRNLASV